MNDREPPRWKKTTWRKWDNYECNRCQFKTLDRGEMVRHARWRHPLASEADIPVVGFDAIDFASDEAAERANALAERGLTPDMLRSTTPSGKGGYTVADVRAAASANNLNTED